MGVLKSLKKQQKVELLKRVRRMLARPKGWSNEGWEIANTDRSYNAYCLGAACQIVAREMDAFRAPDESGQFVFGSDTYSTKVAEEISLLKIVKERGFWSIAGFNDAEQTKKKDVLAVIDERIAQLEAGKK